MRTREARITNAAPGLRALSVHTTARNILRGALVRGIRPAYIRDVASFANYMGQFLKLKGHNISYL